MMCASGHLFRVPSAARFENGVEHGNHSLRVDAVLNQLGSAVLVVESTTLDVTFDNLSARALIGRRGDSNVGRNLSEVLSGQWLELFTTRIEETANGGRSQVDEVALPNPVTDRDGFFRFHWTPLVIPRQSIVSQIGILVVDLTEVRQSQEDYAVFKVEAERDRIATELHDSLAHSLNGLLWQLRSLVFEINGQPALENYVSSLRLIESLGRDLHREFRRAVWALGTDVLRGRTLPDALRAELRNVTEILELGSSFRVQGEWQPLPEEIEQSAAKIFQESVHNVIKHAECSRINVDLEYDAECLRLVIEDDGKGFDPGSPDSSPGFGLRNMVNRAESMHGRISVDSRPGLGTSITVTVPIKRGWDGIR